MFDVDTEEFLASLKEGTRNIYRYALTVFLKFYPEYCQQQGVTDSYYSLKDFFDRIDSDNALPRRDKKRVGRNTLKAFVVWLTPKYKSKTIVVYVGAVQSLGNYLDLELSTKYVGLPTAEVCPENKKHEWSIEEVGAFVDSFESPMYRAIGAAYVQTGCDISTLGKFNYGDIKEEFELGICPLCLDAKRWKTKVPFKTFLGAWALDYLKEYLKTRTNLKPEDALFPFTKQAIDDYFLHHALQFAKLKKFKGRNPYSPHSLRGAFYTLCKDHKTDKDYVDFWMAKTIKPERLAYINKTTESWRHTYHLQAEPWVTPNKYLTPELKQVVSFWEKIELVATT